MDLQEAVEAFGEELLDNDRTTFSYAEADVIAILIGHGVPTLVIRALKEYGFEQDERPVPKYVRGFQSNSHDRWYGPGSSPSHGGSGWEQINGLAGQEG